jgi:YVTN family beta-propeller protein
MAVLGALSALGGAACAPGDPSVVYEYDAYEGDAYPDRRPPLQMPDTGAVLVTNSYSDTLSVLDAKTGATLGTYPVGRDPVSLDGPHHVAVSPSGDAVFVGLSYPVVNASGPHAAHGASVQSGYAQKLDGNDFHVIGQVRVDNNPGDIVLSDDGKRLVLSHFDLQRALKNPGDIEAARATVAVIDPSTMALTGSPAPTRIATCVAPHGVALSRPDGATAFVACYGEDVLAIVDLEENQVTARVPMADGVSGFGDPQYGPYSAVLSPKGGQIAIGNTVSNDIRFFDVKSGKMQLDRTVSTLGSPYFPVWSPDETRLVIPTQSPDAMVVYNLETNQEEAHRDFAGDECPLPHVAARMDDGTLAVTCEGDHKTPGKVLWLDPTTLATLREASVGVYPDALFMFKRGAQ